MTQLSAMEISIAFNAANDKKTWTARASSKPAKGHDMCHFSAKNGLVTISYNAVDGRFAVKFNKYQAAWGDYIKAISRSLYVILNTLHAAGLPFEAPSSPNGAVIEVTSGDDNSVCVRWVEPRKLGMSPVFGMPYGGAPAPHGYQGADPSYDPYAEFAARLDNAEPSDHMHLYEPPCPVQDAIMPELAKSAEDIKLAILNGPKPCPICGGVLDEQGCHAECGYTGEKMLPVAD